MVDAVPFFFALGVVASLVRSGLRLPAAVFETLSIYLLLAIGLKGGMEIARSESARSSSSRSFACASVAPIRPRWRRTTAR